MSFFPSRHRCCDGCTTRTIHTQDAEITEYYHRGVACHLIGLDLALPLDAELQRAGEGEQPAAIRMLDRVFGQYERYFDVVVGDGLYLEAPFVNFCLAHGKHVLVVLKGDHRVLMQDAQALLEMVEPQVRRMADRTVRLWDIEGFTCCEGIEVPIRVVHAEEIVHVRQRIANEWVETEELHTWWWATTAPRKLLGTWVLWRAGHGRWDIENGLFNTLQTHWYLDHCFKHDPVAIINFILTLFIAFILVQHFYQRNCKPSLRERLTLIALTRHLYAGLAREQVQPPWPVPLAGTPP